MLILTDEGRTLVKVKKELKWVEFYLRRSVEGHEGRSKEGLGTNGWWWWWWVGEWEQQIGRQTPALSQMIERSSASQETVAQHYQTTVKKK